MHDSCMDVPKHRAEVGGRLRLTIEALDTTQAAVARVFDLSPSKLGNWLRGDSYPSIPFLIRFCDRYNVTLDWVLRGQVAGVSGVLADDLWRLGAGVSAGPKAAARRVRAKKGASR